MLTPFGLASGVLALPQEEALLAYLHQTVVGLLAACQKLMVGQSELARLRWRLKDTLTVVAERSRELDWRTTPPCTTPNLEVVFDAPSWVACAPIYQLG